MSVNRDRPHIYVLPEDDANRDIANGFISGLGHVVSRRIYHAASCGGWTKVVKVFEKTYLPRLNNQNCHVVMLLDFDKSADRRASVARVIPDDLKDRVFVMGVWSVPEELRAAASLSYEKIGRRCAEGCPTSPSEIWNHDLLKHNAEELRRAWEKLGEILFSSKDVGPGL